MTKIDKLPITQLHTDCENLLDKVRKIDDWDDEEKKLIFKWLGKVSELLNNKRLNDIKGENGNENIPLE